VVHAPIEIHIRKHSLHLAEDGLRHAHLTGRAEVICQRRSTRKPLFEHLACRSTGQSFKVAREQVWNGKDSLFETHPRVAWAIVIATLKDKDTAKLWVSDYKGARPNEPEVQRRQLENRRKMLSCLEEAIDLQPKPATLPKGNILKSAVALEGAAIVPSWDWQTYLRLAPMAEIDTADLSMHQSVTA
jgi:hypothetical protein